MAVSCRPGQVIAWLNFFLRLTPHRKSTRFSSNTMNLALVVLVANVLLEGGAVGVALLNVEATAKGFLIFLTPTPAAVVAWSLGVVGNY